MSLPLGHFHEVSLSTPALETSIAFYEGLGFTRGAILPVWPHPYAVMSRGTLTLGLHEYRFPSPSFTTVERTLDAALEEHRDAGMHIAFAKTGPDCFNEFGFRDPNGHMITLLERDTHSHVPSVGDADREVALLSLPTADRELSQRFWEVLGARFIGECRWNDQVSATRLEAAGLTLALHEAADNDQPLIVIRGETRLSADMSPEGVSILMIG